MNRFFVTKSDIQGEILTLSPRHAHHIRNVLRLRPGGRIIVLDNAGREYEATLTEIGKKHALARIESERPAAGEPQTQITLFQAMLTREKFETVLQKCTELGVTRFAPVLTQRSIVRKTAAAPARLDRRRTILAEAAEQSHRGMIPRLDEPVQFAKAIESLADFDCCLIASPAERQMSLNQALRSKDNPRTIALLIGPEGGFTDAETALAADAGAIAFALGPRILRTETAAIVASAIILHESGQMLP